MVVAGSDGTPRAVAADRADRLPGRRAHRAEAGDLSGPTGRWFTASFSSAGGSAKKPGIVFVHGGPPRQMLLGWHYMDYYSNGYA